MTECEQCVHKRICDIWSSQECQDASLFVDDCFEPIRKGKKFIEIVVKYPAICSLPGYEGKPYFLIRYEENGEEIEGFGTYKPEVLSEYIREYFIGDK